MKFIKHSVVDPGPDPYWIRIQELLDPDPFSEYGSGSTHVKIGSNKRQKV